MHRSIIWNDEMDDNVLEWGNDMRRMLKCRDLIWGDVYVPKHAMDELRRVLIGCFEIKLWEYNFQSLPKFRTQAVILNSKARTSLTNSYNHYRTDGEIQIRPDYYRLGLGKRCSLLSHHSNLYYLHVDFRSRFDINISGIDSCFSFCQNDHNKSAFSWFFMKRDRELPGVFQASSSKYGVIQLGQRGFLLLSILQLSLLSHSLLRHSIFLVFRLLLTTLSQILEDTTSIDQPGLVLNSTFHHLLSVGRGEARQGKPVTELEILNALALDCYPTLYSAKEIECKTWICIWLARFYYLEA
ncbi:hypothetical protein VNO77_27139 [Canavalia gladiata]|uniref:Uncharacterized protein n=1 Tax=Canavalia gladiata TaxID=3824 RepID=A0AAN9KUU7_CANGL